MSEQTAIAKKPESGLQEVKNLFNAKEVKERLRNLLGSRDTQFMASIVNAVAASEQLQNADPRSIMSAAFIAATYDLPVDSNLGFAAIVPYNKSVRQANGAYTKKTVAQFQIMYKGLIQLAIRTGAYELMNCSEVYEDELQMYNPITGECTFVSDFNKTAQRANGETDKIIGYYGWFKLGSGFTKGLYMSKAEVENHAKKYSQAYRYDIDQNKSTSKWSTDFDAMAKKTVIKMLFSKWGILSVQMQDAIVQDQKTFDDNTIGEYGDNEPEVIEAVDPFQIADNSPEEEFDITG